MNYRHRQDLEEKRKKCGEPIPDTPECYACGEPAYDTSPVVEAPGDTPHHEPFCKECLINIQEGDYYG